MTQKHKRQTLKDALDEIRRCYHDAIATEIQHSNKSYALIASAYGVSEQTVYTIGRERGISRTSRQRKANQSLAKTEMNSRDGGSDHER
jgi:DNA invertase Pin-like site-specific DNA recombinase